MINAVARLGQATIDTVVQLGFAARFVIALLRHSGMTFRRVPLLIRDLYFAGVL